MNIYEFDWRRSATSQVINAISKGLLDVQDSVAPVDIDDALGQWESQLGVAFVEAQVYINGTVADACKISNSSLGKHDLMKTHGNPIPGTNVSDVQLCYEIANYYKHHEEWPNWIPEKQRKKTIEILDSVGITQHETHPCRRAANSLWTPDSPDLQSLLSIIIGWREKVIAAVI